MKEVAMHQNKFSCPVNKDYGGTHLWIDSEDGEVSIHTLSPWENGIRKELVVCLEGEQLKQFKEQVAKL